MCSNLSGGLWDTNKIENVPSVPVFPEGEIFLLMFPF